MNNWSKKRDILREKYCGEDILQKACDMLQRPEQTEEGFLGAQGILLLNGLL